MKIHALIAAAVFAAATPAAAQTAPAANPHQGHDMTQPGHAGHSEHGQPRSGQQSPHGDHAARDCCADRNGNGRMDCCETMAEDGQQPAARPGGTHRGHDRN